MGVRAIIIWRWRLFWTEALRSESQSEVGQRQWKWKWGTYCKYIPPVTCVIYTTPRYVARKTMQNGSIIHRAGEEFVLKECENRIEHVVQPLLMARNYFIYSSPTPILVTMQHIVPPLASPRTVTCLTHPHDLWCATQICDLPLIDIGFNGSSPFLYTTTSRSPIPIYWIVKQC